METWGNAWPTYLYFKIRSEETVTLYICYTNNEINEKSGCPQKMLDLLDNGQACKSFCCFRGAVTTAFPRKYNRWLTYSVTIMNTGIALCVEIYFLLFCYLAFLKVLRWLIHMVIITFTAPILIGKS